jgi:hypothetical protein
MSRFVFFSQHYYNFHIKEDKMVGADFVLGREEKCKRVLKGTPEGIMLL